MLKLVSFIVFVFDSITGFIDSVFQPVQSLAPAEDLRKKALLGRYGSNFKYTEFQAMSSVASVVMYTVAIAFGFGLLLVSPVSYNDTEAFFWLTFTRFVILLRSCFRNQGKVPQKSK